MLKHIELVIKINPISKNRLQIQVIDNFTGQFSLTLKDSTIQITGTISENVKMKKNLLNLLYESNITLIIKPWKERIRKVQVNLIYEQR